MCGAFAFLRKITYKMNTMVKKKVYFGLSGGVDSSVAAALLLEQGHDVVPVFLKCWEESDFKDSCPWEEDQKMALEVAEKLGIADKFQSWNFSQEFFESVVQYLIDEAKEGRTGNPDVVCNRTIKFGAFLERAFNEDADFVATGHYARVRKIKSGFELLRPRCEAKNDQTYFLWQLSQNQLSRALFPIGEFESKEAVREEAKRRGLPTAERKSTRGICFVGKVGQTEFLSQFLPHQSGDVVTTSGKVVGKHQGVNFYTLGQRQGIGVMGGGGPYYVIEKNEMRNELIVAPPAETPKLWKNQVVIGELHWISGYVPQLPFRGSAFIRHPQQNTVPCVLSQNHEERDASTTLGAGAEPRRTVPRSSAGSLVAEPSASFRVQFNEPQWAPTPGQSIVLYDNEVVLGGGVIQ